MSSSFRVRCGGCRTKLEVRPEACGLTIPCPTCGKTLAIPGTPPAANKPESAPAARPTVFQSKAAAHKPTHPDDGHPQVVQPEYIEPVRDEPEVLELDLENTTVAETDTVELTLIESETEETELPVAEAFEQGPADEDRTPEEEALLNLDLSQVRTEPVRRRRRESDDLLPSRAKKGRSQESDEDTPYWLRQHGLRDDQRSSGFRMNSTVIGGIISLFFGLVFLATTARLAVIGFGAIWGPILMLGGMMAIWRGIRGE